MLSIARRIVLGFQVLILASHASAEEIVVENVSLPGASINQEVTYSTSRIDYNNKRDARLARMKAGDPSAFVNDPDPWKRVDTTATIGFAFKGVGTSSGRKNIRQISASEEALYIFHNMK